MSVFFELRMTFHRLLSAGLFALTLGAVGCAVLPNAGDDTCAALGTDDGGCGLTPFGDAGGDSPTVAWDGGADGGVAAPLARLSLCSGDCKPDNAQACVAAPDAGDAGDDAGDQSCRVVLGAGQQTSAACASSGQGLDGASCTSGADCAAGYECVGTGTCRHYCCEDTACTSLTNNSYDTYFCDVATEHAASGAIVPVCQIVKECQLFGADQCNAGEACTIVEIDSGKGLVASCAATGDAKLGESCETAHCAAGYACIGAIGLRKCEQLCDDQNPCPSNSLTPNCNTKSQALLQFNGVGVCGG